MNFHLRKNMYAENHSDHATGTLSNNYSYLSFTFGLLVILSFISLCCLVEEHIPSQPLIKESLD